MNERDIEIERGTIDLAPHRRRYDPFLDPAEVDHGQRRVYPLHYVDIHFLSDEEKAARNRRDELARQQEIDRAVARFIGRAAWKQCARCGRDIKKQYTHCYRCFNYLQVKARIAKGA